MTASRTTNGFTLKALLSAAAWYTAPMAAASSALMFFPSSSLGDKAAALSIWEWPLPALLPVAGQLTAPCLPPTPYSLAHSLQQHLLNFGNTGGPTYQDHLLNLILQKGRVKCRSQRPFLTLWVSYLLPQALVSFMPIPSSSQHSGGPAVQAQALAQTNLHRAPRTPLE